MVSLTHRMLFNLPLLKNLYEVATLSILITLNKFLARGAITSAVLIFTIQNSDRP